MTYSQASRPAQPVPDHGDNHQPIGVFDSGAGGLTVLKELERQLPNEPLLYLGDTARVPYGTRSPEEIVEFARQIIRWMVGRNVKMVVMACNTSSALALDTMRQEFDLPILGLIQPAAALASSRGQRIGVIATPTTAKSHAYRDAIRERSPHTAVWEVGCPEFVPIVEEGRIHHPETLGTVRTYIQPLLDQGIDSLVYGCTHYPHLAPVLDQVLPRAIVRIDPAVSIVRDAKMVLDNLELHHTGPLQSHRFCVTGDKAQFSLLANQWLNEPPAVEQVSLSATSPTPIYPIPLAI
ncbi:MAG: glutamate racemase [Cyanobacteria bacterium P01_C01_bin.89]